MTPEDRLRQAMEAHASHVEPSTDALSRIEEKLMDAQRSDNRKRVLLGVGAAAAVVAIVLAAVVLTGDDEEPVSSEGTTSTSEPTSTTESTTTTTASQGIDPAVPVWPHPDTSQRFDEPQSLAHSFAVDFLGMTQPVVGEFQAGDARSGEVPVQPRAEGPVTTVIVRQLEDDTWFVLGAATDDIRLDAPAAGASIECPVQLTGEALAFEGTVQVSVRDDVSPEPIGTGFVTGGGGPSAPFDGTVDCDVSHLDDGVHYGAIVLSTESGEDGSVWQATVVRVQLK